MTNLLLSLTAAVIIIVAGAVSLIKPASVDQATDQVIPLQMMASARALPDQPMTDRTFVFEQAAETVVAAR